MRVNSAASALHPQWSRIVNKVPTPGSKIRLLYDLFQENKGKFIRVSGQYDSISCLRDFYGLDIRTFQRGQYCLVGEWFGKAYIDYLASE
jgi:hypothetical protein